MIPTSAGLYGSRAIGGKDALSVMTCNVGDIEGSQEPVREAVVDFLKKLGDFDLLFLQEVGSKDDTEYFSKELGLPYFVFLNDFQRTYGIAILSKIPLLNDDWIYFKAGKRGSGAISAEIMAGDKRVQVVNVHMESVDPVSIENGKVAVNLKAVIGFVKTEICGESIRSQSARELIQWLGEKKAERVIIGGDFNTVPFSKTIQIMGAAFDDALWPSLAYFTGTYKKLDFPLSPRIDFFFISANLSCRDAYVLARGIDRKSVV